MIRDPSDGSVKSPPVKPELTNSGLAKPETESEKERLRLEQGREWLRDWKEKNR